MSRRTLLPLLPLLLPLLLAPACTGGLKKEVGQLRSRVHRLEKDVARNLAQRQSAQDHGKTLARKVARLEAQLARIRARMEQAPAPRTSPDPAPARAVASCPGDLPAAVRKLRRKMRLADVKRQLGGVTYRESKAITLTGAGTRTRRVLDGPCFRITFQDDRVTEVALEGVMPRTPPRRRRRRRRRR